MHSPVIELSIVYYVPENVYIDMPDGELKFVHVWGTCLSTLRENVIHIQCCFRYT